MKISSIAVVSASNTPLYITTFDAEEDSLRLQALMHAALDVFEERVALGCRQTPSSPPDAFLGLLSLSEGYAIYGMVSNTKIKFMIATRDAAVREEDAKKVLSEVHTAYVDAVSNPFYSESMLNSSKFESAMKRIAALPPSPLPAAAAAAAAP